MTTGENLELLRDGEIVIEGRLVDASNATLFTKVSRDETSIFAIYKPIAGERPLWDFPDGNLASRERAAYLINVAMNLDRVPLTILRDGPFGPGMVQEWVDVDETVDLELFFQSDDQQLREVALFDAVINNTDRKIGHLLPDQSGHLFICDHGVTFHEENKLRTVLWQWAGQSLSSAEISRLNSLSYFLNDLESSISPAREELSGLLTAAELRALNERIEDLISTEKFPEPNPEWPHIPWPPF